MDEIVIRGMMKWPNVPSVYGWLSLDRRGAWLIKNVSGRFERIAHPTFNEFIGRNYASDADGRWYFQNGPQRVFVALDYTPWVYRLDDAGEGLLAHTGAAAREPRTVFVDDSGAVLLETEMGIGVLLDRDLPALVERLPERLLDDVGRGEEARARFLGRSVRVAPIRGAEVPARFSFVQRPAPPAGEPDCT